MNKLFIVLLAVCLVSTHAFVKRDTSATQDLQAQLEALQKSLADLTKDIKDQVDKVLNPDQIKAEVNKLIDNTSKAINSLKPTEQPGAAEAGAGQASA